MHTQFDRLLDQFEAEFRSGNSPPIGSYLTQTDEESKPRVLRELISLEIHYRVKLLQNVELEDYARFGKDALVHAEQVWARIDQLSATVVNTTSQARTRYSDETASQSGTRIGRYRLVEKIGEGGMGEVWLAEQEEPVKRRVALKLIRSELASKNVIARFEAEQQALALMDHLNIAKVLDAGTTATDRPFFVMELVDGIPITQYCDKNQLSVDQRLQLFVQVCRAIQHAHLKGIIHRDLKPTNVLATLLDGQTIPKVIDFGLAKATQGLKLTDKTMMTEFGAVVGTLQYMSPEQAELKGVDADDVDTRTDIYSLGVMLYELLTGSTPLDKKTLGQNALLKVLRIIREEVPPRPSNRLSSSSHEVTAQLGSQRPPGRR